MVNSSNKDYQCIATAILELKAEQKDIEEKNKAIEEEKRNIIIKERELSKNMEKNFLEHKNQIVDLLKEGIPPEKICKKFENCGVQLDLMRVKNCDLDNLTTAEEFGNCMLFIGAVVILLLALVYGIVYAPVVVKMFCIVLVLGISAIVALNYY